MCIFIKKINCQCIINSNNIINAYIERHHLFETNLFLFEDGFNQNTQENQHTDHGSLISYCFLFTNSYFKTLLS